MKGHKKHHKAKGGHVGVNEAEMDLKTRPEPRTNAKEIDKEAEERKHGGRAKRKHGGKAPKHEMMVEGHHGKHHAGRKPRKHGGKTSGNIFAFTAHKGTEPKAHTVEMGMK